MNRWIKLGVSLIITVASFAWTFKGVDWDKVTTSLKAANWLMLIPYLGLLTLVHIFRTLRWGNLLSGMEKVPFKKLNEASAIGFMLLIVLPFRLGEFARPFLIAERSSIRRSPAMTTVVFERIVDGISIAVLMLVLILFLPREVAESPNGVYVQGAAYLMFAIFFGGLMFLLLAWWKREAVLMLIRRIVDRLSPKLTDKVIGIVDGFVGALNQLPDAKNLFLFFFFTACYWGLSGFGSPLLATAFDCSHAAVNEVCHPLSLTPYQGFVTLCVLIIGLMIPAAPGSAGLFQAALMMGLSLFFRDEVVKSTGFAFANVAWVIQIMQQILFGLIFMGATRSSFSDIAGKLRGGNSGPVS